MDAKQQISYADWLNLVKASRLKGRKCPEFAALCVSSPILGSEEYDAYIHNEMASLEVELIRTLTYDFQKSVNHSFEEQDLYIFETGLRDLKKAVTDCLFFDKIPAFSIGVKNNLKKEIWMNLSAFLGEFSKYMRKMSEYGGDPYIDEFLYIYKKADINKFIREQVTYE